MKFLAKSLAVALLACGVSGPAFAEAPKGWFVAGSTPQDYDFGAEHVDGSAGAKSAFIRAKTDAPHGFGTLMQEFVPQAYRGKRVRLSARLRTADAARAQLWMRMDGPDNKILGFYNMDDRPVVGTAGWSRYDIVLDVPDKTTGLAFGVFLNGRGEVWMDDFKFEIVSNAVPVSVNPAAELKNAPSNLGFDQ
ncbi:MAG: hypothetical protein WDM81_17775 [Rhizomicrobium sp.]